MRFVLSGSSARKTRRTGTNLLAGRARMRNMFPLVSAEAGADFNIEKVLRYGALPTTFIVDSAEDYLQSYS